MAHMRTSKSLLLPLVAVLAALLTTAALALVVSAPAQAHSELIGSSPAEGEEIYAPPEAVSLEFNEDVSEIGNEVVVTRPDGTAVTDGDPQVDGPTVTQPLGDATMSEDAIGTYTVTWRVVSADGHPISGEFTFEVLRGTFGDAVEETSDATTEATAGATTDDADETTQASVPPSSADAEDEADGSDAAIPIIIVVVVLVVAAGVFLVARRRRAR